MNIALTAFPNLRARDPEHFEKTAIFALGAGLLAQLEVQLTHLCRVPTSIIELRPDSVAPHSFLWIEWLTNAKGEPIARGIVGGLIYHGPHDRGGDGSAPTFSVNLEPIHGWAIHT